ncbi:hypothetical protein CU254_39915 [Amycolatopsis sp. AA4]|uniref:hypothetical protein n=1 Tax=Actinomycetes TaxID=1760 RepID=UPI0001B586E3|nr:MULTISPECIES: hypothetical protein [Actinomycetes]ATY15868.1 hypothetical protein CU254_39915 [Amycolatopsis sp. AA4]EFL12193.1 predicted protein [Streptomyces sp. AA4]
MSWQEELRRLDEELASGRLSADDYRIRRDQVLSSAVGQQDQPAPPPPSQSADSTQVIAPVSPPGGFPQQQPQAPQQPPADGGAERTQVVQSWQTQQPPADAGPERTQVVQPQQHQPQAHYSPPGGFPQGTASPPAGFPQQQPWNAAESDQTPPWGGGDLPPLGPSGGDSEWVRQGPEYFTDKPKKSNGKKIGAIVGAVIVLAGIAFGAYWLWGRDSGGGGTEQTTAQHSQSSAAPKPPDPLGVASMPGKAETHDDVTSFSQVDTLKYLNPQELSAYQAAGSSKVKFVVYHLEDGNVITLFLAQASSPTAAKTAAEKLMDVQVTNGAKRDTTAPNGVYATAIDPKEGQSAQSRGHYSHGNVIVRVEVSGKVADQTKTDFTTALNQQLTVLTADA